MHRDEEKCGFYHTSSWHTSALPYVLRKHKMVSSHSLDGHLNLRWNCVWDTTHPGHGLGERHRGEKRTSLPSQQDKVQRRYRHSGWLGFPLTLAMLVQLVMSGQPPIYIWFQQPFICFCRVFVCFLFVCFLTNSFHHAAMDTYISFYRAITAEADRGAKKSHDFKSFVSFIPQGRFGIFCVHLQ